MCKVDAEHQLCLEHGVHLAVLDVLYQRTPTPSSEASKLPGEMEAEDVGLVGDSDTEADRESDDEADNDDQTSGGDFQVEIDTCEAVAQLAPQYRQVIDKVRKIVKMFSQVTGQE